MDDQRNLPPGHRGIRLGESPTTSVVVASARDRGALERCLAALLPVCTDRGVEIVVARNCPLEEYRALEKAFPSVLFMPAPDGASRRQLRAVGLSAAEGDIVTLIDDSTVPDAEWVTEFPDPPPPAGETGGAQA